MMKSYERPSICSSCSTAGGVLRARPIDLIAARQNVEAGLVLDDELAQELLVHPVQVVEGVDQRESRPDAEKQRDLADELMQIDDERRPLRQTRDVDGAVDRERRRAGAAFGAEEGERDAGARAVLGRAAALDRALQRRVKRVGAVRCPARSMDHARYSLAPARIARRI